MDKLHEVTDYINQMKIKKTFFGGYDREDVYTNISMLVSLFQKCLKEYEEKEKALIEDYESRMRASELLTAELNKKVAELTEEQQNVIVEKQKMREAYKEYYENILEQYSGSLRSLSAEFAKILDNVTTIQKGLMEEDIYEGLDKALEMKRMPVIGEGKSDEI